MKRTLQIALLAALSFCVAGVAVAYDGTYTPGAGVIKSPHDLTPGNGGMGYGANPADSLQRVCIFCHAPHNTYKLAPENGGPDGLGAGPTAPTDYTYLPLWNHTPSLNDAYSMYVHGFQTPWVLVIYLVGMTCLLPHLLHGVSSTFQSLGWRHPKYDGAIDKGGPALALVLYLGYIIPPVAVYLHAIKLPRV